MCRPSLGSPCPCQTTSTIPALLPPSEPTRPPTISIPESILSHPSASGPPYQVYLHGPIGYNPYSPYSTRPVAHLATPVYPPPASSLIPPRHIPPPNPAETEQSHDASSATSGSKRKQTQSAASRNGSKRPALQAQTPAQISQVSVNVQPPPFTASVPSLALVTPGPPAASPSPVPSTPCPQPRHVAAVCGVGPSGNARTPPPVQPSPTVIISAPPESETSNVASAQSTVPFPTSKQTTKHQAATDVWYFVRRLQSSSRELFQIPEPDQEPRLSSKPNSPSLGCRLCWELPTQEWKWWKNGSITDTLRTHFQRHHGPTWSVVCEEMRLKGHAVQLTKSPSKSRIIGRTVFSIEEVRRRLVEWIVADDQSLRVVDVPEFRRLLLALGAGNVLDCDLPHRTGLAKLIAIRYKLEEGILKEDLQRSIGRISLTMDLWSDDSLRSFMAISAHFCKLDHEGDLRLETQLLAFRYVETDHGGLSLAKVFFKILREYGIAEKIGQITLDNASNNNTFMSSLCAMIDATGRSFSAEGNRVRCFPHVINIAVQAMLDRLSKGGPPDGYRGSDGMVVFYSAEYLAALNRDIVGVCRSVVTAMRASGARRLGLQNFITLLNKHNSHTEQIPLLCLLRDCETRWSSCFMMLTRFMTLWPAVQGYIKQSNDRALTKHLMGDTELTVLVDVIQVLEGAHAVQQVLSAEKTPTLSNALPEYALLIDYWTSLSRSIPQLSYIMEVGIAKIQEYVDRSRTSKIHVLAMVINPSTKLEWIESNWTPAEARQAKSWVLEHMLAFQKLISRERRTGGTLHERSPTSNPITHSSGSVSTHATGLGSIRNLSTARRSASLAPGIDSPTTSTTHLPVSRENTPVPELTAASQEEQDQADRKTVELELENYMQDGTLESKGLDMLRFWRHHSRKYPTLYRIALDVLPAQASAVPCERAFSSSKETLTKRRNRLSPALVEALQHLKFLVRQQRLNFMLEQDVAEGELSIEERDSRITVTREMIRGAIESDDPENALGGLIEDIEGESGSV